MPEFPATDPDEPLPTVVLLMAEHGGAFLWDRSPGGYGDVPPDVLGFPRELVSRLSAWNARFEAHASRWDWGPPPHEQAADDRREWEEWRREGLHLAHDLQHELDALGHAIEVRYSEDGDDRPVSGRRGR